MADTHQGGRLHDADGDLVYEEREVFIADIPSAAWHSWKTIVFDEINDKIYLSVGSPCDLCRPEAPVAGAGSPSAFESHFTTHVRSFQSTDRTTP